MKVKSMKTKPMTVIILMASCLLANGAFAAVTVDREAGGVVSLAVAGATLKPPANGAGFHLWDAVHRRPIQLTGGTIAQSGGNVVFKAGAKGDISITAEFADKGNHIVVSGVLENLKGDERGVMLDYIVPFDGENSVFSNGLNMAVDVAGIRPSAPQKDRKPSFDDKRDKKNELEGNVYPVAAMRGQNGALALAIPPTEPREFGMVGGASGLAVRFYLGLTPRTLKFPNSASFVFIIYPVDPAWGFRGALEKYYSFYSEFYTPRIKRHGEMLFNFPVGKEPPDMEHYIIDRVGAFFRGNTTAKQIARNKKHGILSHGYMNVGVVELSGLPRRPDTQEEAYAMYQEMCESIVEWEEGGPDPTPCEQINTSACKFSNGLYNMHVRNAGGLPATKGNTGVLAFKTNPNPALYEGRKVSIGKRALLTMDKWLEGYPSLDGVVIDSLGANWPAALNYRDDHFEFARFPLSFDPDGRVALHNAISYYEFLDAMRSKLLAKNKYLFGNGVYPYPARAQVEPEHPRGRVRVGRFFMAALLDLACAEPGLKMADYQAEFFRVSMGRKPYTLTNTGWSDPVAMEKWLNKTLVYGFCGSNVREIPSTGGTRSYYPEGYERDKELKNWYMSNLDIITKAGWQPVTNAAADGKKVLMERFGSGDTVYFVVMSEHDAIQTCALKPDLAALGFKSGDNLSVAEIARSVPVTSRPAGVYELQLEPFKTCIVALRKQ
jgi:hypothetical protein